YVVVVPDQRGHGRTLSGLSPDTGLTRFEEYPIPYWRFNVIHTLGYNSMHAVVDHDFGPSIAGRFYALVRPDLFECVVVMSAGALSYTAGGRRIGRLASPVQTLRVATTREANADMHGVMKSRGGLHAFLRAYYHAKSAD
ncbi:hypothetical protein BJY52DRAFT_1093483, partial [Lactarius psammicola]